MAFEVFPIGDGVLRIRQTQQKCDGRYVFDNDSDAAERAIMLMRDNVSTLNAAILKLETLYITALVRETELRVRAESKEVAQ